MNFGGIEKLVNKRKACQTDAKSQGMVLGEPETIEYVQNCLGRHAQPNSSLIDKLGGMIPRFKDKRREEGGFFTEKKRNFTYVFLGMGAVILILGMLINKQKKRQR